MRRRRILRWRHLIALRFAPWLKRDDGWQATNDWRGLVHVVSYEDWRKADPERRDHSAFALPE